MYNVLNRCAGVQSKMEHISPAETDPKLSSLAWRKPPLFLVTT